MKRLLLKPRRADPQLLAVVARCIECTRAVRPPHEGRLAFAKGGITGWTWSAGRGGELKVDLIEDSNIPAVWISLHSGDPAAEEEVKAALAESGAMESIQDLRSEAASPSPPRGALQRLGIHRAGEAGLEESDLLLFAAALGAADRERRADAVCGAMLWGDARLRPALEAALQAEPDADLRGAIRYALRPRPVRGTGAGT